MVIIDVSQPLTIILLLAVTVLLIFLGKEVKKPQILAVMLVAFLALVLMHSIQINLAVDESAEYVKLLRCIPIDLIFTLIFFFGYLWIDQIACETYKKNNIDNSLDWFWKNV